MAISAWQWVSAMLLLVCLACFGWAMRRFFVQPAGDTRGMRVIRLSSTICTLLTFAAILTPPGVTFERGSVGALVYVFALGLFWWAIRANSQRPLSAAFSPDTPAHLMEHGPYRFVRHPFYCSYVLAWFAGLIATARWWLIPAVAWMVAIYIRAAAVEEKKFSDSPLAGAYDGYRSRTGLFVPNPMKLLLARRLR